MTSESHFQSSACTTDSLWRSKKVGRREETTGQLMQRSILHVVHLGYLLRHGAKLAPVLKFIWNFQASILALTEKTIQCLLQEHQGFRQGYSRQRVGEMRRLGSLRHPHNEGFHVLSSRVRVGNVSFTAKPRKQQFHCADHVPVAAGVLAERRLVMEFAMLCFRDAKVIHLEQHTLQGIQTGAEILILLQKIFVSSQARTIHSLDRR